MSWSLSEDNNEKKHVMVSLGSVADPKLKLRTLEWTLSGPDVKLQDIFYPIRAVASSRCGQLPALLFQRPGLPSPSPLCCAVDTMSLLVLKARISLGLSLNR